MANPVRRAHFSLLLWPSLYSLRTILLLPLAFAALAGFCALLFHLSRQNERQVLSRASERVQSVIALKLSGTETWQWKRQLACEKTPDCLKVRLSFTPPEKTGAYVQKTPAQAACKICHAKEFESNSVFYATFETIAVGQGGWILQWLTLGLIGIAAIGTLVGLFYLRAKRFESGICIAAFEFSGAAPERLRLRLAAALNSRASTYYYDAAKNRLRIATTPEKFATWLAKNTVFLEENRMFLRAAALHVDLQKNAILPIEALRGIYQFLARTPDQTYLIQEGLAVRLKMENGRRLVFKNKSGALLKFIAWGTP